MTNKFFRDFSLLSSVAIAFAVTWVSGCSLHSLVNLQSSQDLLDQHHFPVLSERDEIGRLKRTININGKDKLGDQFIGASRVKDRIEIWKQTDLIRSGNPKSINALAKSDCTKLLGFLGLVRSILSISIPLIFFILMSRHLMRSYSGVMSWLFESEIVIYDSRILNYLQAAKPTPNEVNPIEKKIPSFSPWNGRHCVYKKCAGLQFPLGYRNRPIF